MPRKPVKGIFLNKRQTERLMRDMRMARAAPDLLTSLKAVMRFWATSKDGEDMPPKMFDGAYSAIRKAEGRK